MENRRYVAVPDQRRVGVLRIGSIGDHVITIPIYKALRTLHARDSLILISNIPASGNSKLVGPASILPPQLFDEICAYPALAGWRDVAAFVRLFRRLRLQRLYYLMPKRTPAQLRRDRLSLGLLAREVIGLNAVAIEPVRRGRSRGLFEHEADRLARAVGIASGTADRSPSSLSLDLSPAERSSLREAVERPHGVPARGPAVVVSVGTKFEVNHWGAHNWRRLIQHLAELDALKQLFLVGSADEYAECEALKAVWPREAANLCGKLSPRESAALMAESSLFVGHDSGPMHLAAAVGVPIVAIFSSRNPPGVWYPLSARSRTHYTMIDCMGCLRERCEDRRKACIRAIGVEDVFASCCAMLELPAEKSAAAHSLGAPAASACAGLHA